jgi:RHS repeat-associated protein
MTKCVDGTMINSWTPSYYRARYYDPSAGRFIAEDPIRFGGGINFYQFVRNSAIDLVDPSGEAIGLAPGSGGGVSLPGTGHSGRDDAYNQLQTAMLYLEQSPDAAAIIQELQQSPQLYLVGVADYEQDGTLSHNFVKWNPSLGGRTISGHGAESPALLLLHEFVHLQQAQRGFDSGDEEAVTQITNRVAGQLGEAKRVNYGDSRYNNKSSWPLPIPIWSIAKNNCECKQ